MSILHHPRRNHYLLHLYRQLATFYIDVNAFTAVLISDSSKYQQSPLGKGGAHMSISILQRRVPSQECAARKNCPGPRRSLRRDMRMHIKNLNSIGSFPL